MPKERGRPPIDGSKKNRCEIRMTDEEVEQLEFMTDKTGLTKTEVVRNALKMYHNLVKVQHFDG